MAKKDNGSGSFEEQQKLEAKKKLKEAQKQPRAKKEKKAKPEKKKRRFGRWFKDFRGETKKITWPDFKSVMKGTGVVLVCIIVVGSLVWIVDFALTNSIALARDAAVGDQTTTTAPPRDDLPGFEAPTIPGGLPEADADDDADADDADDVDADEADDTDEDEPEEENEEE